jgi:hypothetical protein
MEHSELARVVATVDELIKKEAGNYYGNRRGACDQVNGMMAQVARNLGFSAVLVRGYIGEEEAAHTWIRIGELSVDLAGAQFGRDQVRIFSSDPDYHELQTELPGERTQLYPEDEAIVRQATEALLSPS